MTRLFGKRNGMWGRRNPNGGAKPKPALERFKRLFVKRGPDECWNWISIGKRYPAFSVGKRCEGAHRAAYLLYVGDIPDGKCVLHKCDNPRCVNPRHLFLGTLIDNNKDCAKKGRQPGSYLPGESNGRSKMTKFKVLKLRRLHATGRFSRNELGRMFKICGLQVTRMVRRLQWSHV